MENHQYQKSRIINKHGQLISYLYECIGKSELEKCLNFSKNTVYKFHVFTILITNRGMIHIVFDGGIAQLFNSDGEKVKQLVIDYEPLSASDMKYELEILGYTI